MNKKAFEIFMSNEPEKPSDRYMFLVDSKALSERIVLVGYRSTPILSYDTGGECYTLETFMEYMTSLDCKGTCRADHIYVVACSMKSVNDALSSYLSSQLLSFRSGWRLFHNKPYLEDLEHEEELKQILNEYISQSEGSVKPSIKAVSMSDIEEEDVEWLVPNYIPSGQITLLVGDGGQGKTSIWCNLVAGITSGRKTIFDTGNPFSDFPSRCCMFFSAEDSVPKVLKRKLRKAGADEGKVLFVDLTDDNFELIKFDSPVLEELISENKPAVVVFDPLQSFIPSNVQMSSRNAMRQCMNPLISLGEKYGTAFIIVMHTNKKIGVSGRTRCADSADIWDIARSVLIVGNTGDGDIHYISHEKSNYAAPENTLLYTIEDDQVIYQGTSEKKDRDYVTENAQVTRSAPARDEAKEVIMNILSDDEEHEVSELDGSVKSAGISFATLKRAKEDLKREGKVKYRCEGFGKDKIFYIRRS